MFNKTRYKIRYLTIGIASVILIVAFLSVYFIMKNNIVNESKRSIDQAIETIIKKPFSEEYKETDLMIFKLDDKVAMQFNDNYRQYNPSVLQELYAKCKDTKDTPLHIGNNYFYYSILDLNGDYIYFVYDASLATMNLNLLISLLGAFFIILIIIICFVAVYISNSVVDPIENTYKAQKEFIENASHELKTPLAIIDANVDSLSNIGEDNKKWINNISNQTDRMNKLIIEMLELSKIENQNTSDIKMIDLSNYLKKTILSFEVLAYEKHITLNQEIDDSVLIQISDSNIDKMVNILLDNALKYVSENGYINIKLNKDKKNISLIVENSGGNLDKEDLDKIFNRFYKKNNENSQSFGLGLAILKAIVDSLNGYIKVECEKGKYTRFIVKI